MADRKSTPFRRKLRKNADHFVKFIRGMSSGTSSANLAATNHKGSFGKNLNNIKSLLRSIKMDGYRDIDSIRPIIEFGLNILAKELQLRAKLLDQSQDYDQRRWELVHYIMRLFMGLFDERNTIHDFVPLQRSQSELNKAKLAESLFGQHSLEQMQALALETIDCLELDQFINSPLIASVILETTKVLKISSFKRDIGESFRRAIFELICRFDELEEAVWRQDATKYATECSVLSIFVGPSEEQFACNEPIVEFNYNVHESARNRLIAFYEWSLSFGCLNPSEAKRINVKNLLSVIGLDQDARQVSVALELLSYLEFASQELYPYPESTIHQLDLSQEFFSTQLINLLCHESELVRARANQLLTNWCFAQKSPYSAAHRTTHLALTERITGERSPMVRLQFITLIHAILLMRNNDTKAKRRAYKTSVVQLIAHECVRTLGLVPCSDQLIKLISDLFYEFQNKLAAISEELTVNLIAIYENELQNNRPIGRNVASSLLNFISELAYNEQFKRFKNYSRFKSRTLKLTRSLSLQHAQLVPLHQRLQDTLAIRKKAHLANSSKLAPSPLTARLHSNSHNLLYPRNSGESIRGIEQ